MRIKKIIYILMLVLCVFTVCTVNVKSGTSVEESAKSKLNKTFMNAHSVTEKAPKEDLPSYEIITEEYVLELQHDAEYMDMKERELILRVAEGLIGKIYYAWGGKSNDAGYDEDWTELNNEGYYNGLDCSGFVQWVYRTAGYDDKTCNKLLSTNSIRKNLDTIAEEDLKPGDIGLMKEDKYPNHTGIYAGDGYWIHCNASENTVSRNKVDYFEVYKRAPLKIYAEDKSYYKEVKENAVCKGEIVSKIIIPEGSILKTQGYPSSENIAIGN